MGRQRRGGSFRLSATSGSKNSGGTGDTRCSPGNPARTPPGSDPADRARCSADPARPDSTSEAGVNQHQGGDPLRLRERCVPRDETAERMADQRGAVDLEDIEKADDIRRQFGNRIAGFRPIRVPEAALVDGYRTKALGQERQDPAEREPGVGPPVKEDDGLAIAIAAFHVVETQPCPETDALKPGDGTLDHAVHCLHRDHPEQSRDLRQHVGTPHVRKQEPARQGPPTLARRRHSDFRDCGGQGLRISDRREAGAVSRSIEPLSSWRVRVSAPVNAEVRIPLCRRSAD